MYPQLIWGINNERTTRTSTKAQYWTSGDLANVLDDESNRPASSITVPYIGVDVTVGNLEQSCKNSFDLKM